MPGRGTARATARQALRGGSEIRLPRAIHVIRRARPPGFCYTDVRPKKPDLACRPEEIDQESKANTWRIEVLPPAPRTEDLFLHVLQTDQPQAVSLVRKGEGVGAKVGAAEVLFAGPVGGTLTIGGKTLPLKRGVVTGKYE